MNCRTITGLLSAYIDRELTGEESTSVRAHLDGCAHCRAEQDDLLETKLLLRRLSYQTPRAELESLLLVRASRAANPSLLARLLPPEWTDAMALRWEGVGNFQSPRLRPLAATALLSLAGLCLVSAGVSRPGDEAAGGSGDAPSFAVYVSPSNMLGGGGDSDARVPMLPLGAVPVAYPSSNLAWGATVTPPLLSAGMSAAPGGDFLPRARPTPFAAPAHPHFGFMLRVRIASSIAAPRP